MRFQKPPTGAVLNPLHPLSRGLVGCWLLNEGAGSLVNDISGHHTHGHFIDIAPNVQGSGWSGSKYGGSLGFDGTDDYVLCETDEVLNLTTALSIETKVKMSVGSGTHILTASWVGGTNLGWAIRDSRFSIGNSIATTSIDYTVPTSTWTHLVATYDGTTVSYYANGILINSDTLAGPVVYAESPPQVFFGAQWAGGDKYKGLIDYVRIYNRALSSAEVKMLYEQPYCNLMK